MRLVELVLEGFGCFSAGEKLGPLPGREDTRLVVVHGKNEAGKSTALQAIRWLLFGGTLGKTYAPDGDAARLSVRATVALERGSTSVLDLERSRARGELRGVSRSSTDEVREEWIHGMLGNPSRAVFETIFAFSLEGLAEGARTLAHDAVRGALYGGLGGAVRPEALRDSIMAERDELFRERGRVQRINALSDRVHSLRTAQKQATVSREAVARLSAGVEAAQAGVARTRAELAGIRRRREELEAQVEAAPLVDAIDRVGREVAALGPDVKGDGATTRAMTARWQGAQKELTSARNDEARREAEVLALDRRLAALPRADSWPDEAAALDALREAVAAHDDARATLATARASRQEILQWASRELAEVRPWDLDRLRQTIEGPTRHALAAALAGAAGEAQRRAAQIEEAERLDRELLEIDDQSARLDPPRDLRPLEALLPDLARVASLDRRVASLEGELTTARQGLRRLALTVESGPAPALLRLDDAEIDAFARLAEAHHAHGLRLAERAEQLEAELSDAVRAVEDSAASTVPTEAELTAHRRQRDAAIDGDGARLRALIAIADEAADRMRAEAALVSARTRAEARLGSLEGARGRLVRQRGELAADEARLSEQVSRATAGATDRPLGVRQAVVEARAWAMLVTEIENKQAELAVAQAEVDRVHRLARPYLDRSGDLEAAARAALERAARTAVQREDLADRRRRIVARRSVLDQRLAVAPEGTAEVQTLLEGLGLGDLAPAFAREALSALAELRRAVLEADRAEELAALRADAQEQTLRSVLGRLPAEARGREARAILAQRAAARDLRQARELTASALAKAHEELGSASARVVEQTAVLHGLRVELGAPDDPAAEVTLRLWARAHELVDRLGEMHARLSGLVRRGDLEAFVREIQALGPDGLSARLAVVAQAEGDAVDAYGAAERALGEAERERSTADGGDRAAELRAEVEQARAELAAGVERWAVLTLADRLLEGAIRRFERDHQPALLLRASALFAQMTGGRHQRILRRAGPDQRVVAERSDGELLPPERLSTGTREQMWLALRLAYVESYCAVAEPLPVVLDDVLVNFDEQRVAATLRALADVARATQVLVFTCHTGLVDIVRASGVPAVVVRLE